MDDAQLTLSIGVVAALVAAIAWWADVRRIRRSDPDAVGFMPWTGVFFAALFVACLTLGIGAREWFAG